MFSPSSQWPIVHLPHSALGAGWSSPPSWSQEPTPFRQKDLDTAFAASLFPLTLSWVLACQSAVRDELWHDMGARTVLSSLEGLLLSCTFRLAILLTRLLISGWLRSLSGFVTMQTILYYRTYRNDRFHIKLLVSTSLKPLRIGSHGIFQVMSVWCV